MATPRAQSRRNKRSPTHRSQYRLCNSLHQQVGDRGCHGSGLPGFGRYTGKKWYNSDSKEQDEHDDPPLPATTSNTQEVPVPIARTSKRYREAESHNVSKFPEPIKDDKSPADDKQHHDTGKMSSEPKSSEFPWHFDMCPDAGSSDSNPAEKPIPNEHNKYYPKYFIDEFENLDDYIITYV